MIEKLIGIDKVRLRLDSIRDDYVFVRWFLLEECFLFYRLYWGREGIVESREFFRKELKILKFNGRKY